MVLAENLVIPENIVNEWGYRTTQNDSWQEIKRIEPDGDYYPGFKIRKHCFQNDADAQKFERKLLDEINSKPGAVKVYRNSIVHDSCLFELRTWANYFYLEYQPKMFELLKQFIKERNAHNQPGWG